MNTKYTWKQAKPSLIQFLDNNKELILAYYYDIPYIIFKFCKSIKNFYSYFLPEDYKNVPYQDLYFELRAVVTAKTNEIKILVRQAIEKNSKFVIFTPQDLKYPNPSKYTLSIIQSLYPQFKKLLKDKNIIKKLQNNNSNYWDIVDNLKPYMQQLIDAKVGKLYDIEYKVFYETMTQKYIALIKNSINKPLIKQMDKKSLKIINDYITKNIYQLFLNIDLAKDTSNVYIQSWIDPYGNLDGHELDVLRLILIRNEGKIKNLINTNIPYEQIINDYILLYGPNWERKIYDLISAKNLKLKNQRGKDLLNLDDEINDETRINYDITADHVRTKPIIIINDKKTNKDFVMFGPRGSSHGFYISNKLLNDAQEQEIEINPYKMGYGYLLGKIAFIDKNPDENQFGYTNEDIVDILKNDPRIAKVYQTGGNPHIPGDKIKRLAQRRK